MEKYKIYVSQVIALANSLVIKSIPSADAMNKPLLEKGKPIPVDRNEWRYYMHLEGVMHPDDKPVEIMSLDTNEMVVLNKELLKTHKKTANVYRYNDKYIKRLQYDRVDMFHYCRGVFNPVTREVSIAAPTNTVLYYDPTLVEKQEMSLISDIGRWVEMAHNRFMFEGYVDTNECYVLAFNNILNAMLPGIILNIRTNYANTEEAHSFHVNTYLESHQGLDRFLPYLTQKQKMFLYRNIRYIERNTGKKDIFDWLIDELLTARSMPAVGYNLGQKVHILEDGELLPRTVAVVDNLNFREQVSGRDQEQLDLYTLIRKEYDLAPLNPEYDEIYFDDLQRKLALTQHPEQKTKLIEVTAIDPENNNPFLLIYDLFNEWVHTATIGFYDQSHEILNPQSGDVLRLTTREMLAMYLYAAFKGYSNVVIPFSNSFNAMGVARKRWVTREEFEGLFPEGYVGRYEPIIDFYAKTQTEHAAYKNIVSSDDFYNYVVEINTAKLSRYWYGYNLKRDTDQSTALAVFNYHYPDYNCKFNLDYYDYDDFFKSFGVDYEVIPQETWKDIAIDCFNKVTGYDNNSEVSFTDIQRAMVELVAMLSSYTIHFAQQIASESRLLSDCLGVVVDESRHSEWCNVWAKSPDGELVSAQVEKRHSLKPIELEIEADAKLLQHYRFLGNVGVDASCKINIIHKVSAGDPTSDIIEVRNE